MGFGRGGFEVGLSGGFGAGLEGAKAGLAVGVC